MIPVHTTTSGFADGAWSWTDSSHPGGGLLLNTSLPSPNEYSLRLVFKFDTFYSTWTKVISFLGYNSSNHSFSSDNGLYFYDNKLQFYPYITNQEIPFSPNVWYDLVFTRNTAGLIRFFMTPLGQPQQLVLEFTDPGVEGIPSSNGNNYCWGLFYDDTWTSWEWTYGGSVALVEVWGQAYFFDKVQNLQISNVGNQFNLSWDPFPGALSYTVYASNDPDSETWELIGSVPGIATSFISTESRKFFRIQAVLN